MESTSRDHYFDNLKGILIILVVFGHTLELFPQSPAIQFTYLLVYSFHMPLFAFCSGYFSVHLTPKKALQNICYPYFVWQTVYFLFYTCVLNSGTALSYASPIWILWYLLSCFLWFLLCPLFQARSGRGALLGVAFSLLLGILIGFDGSIHRYLSLSRTIALFPFYLCGYHFHTRKAQLVSMKARLDGTVSRRVSPSAAQVWFPAGVTLLCACGVLCLALIWKKLDANWFYLANGYAQPREALFRLCYYVLAASICLFLMLITPRKHSFLSTIGNYSIVIYLLHGLLIRWLDGRIPVSLLSLSAPMLLLAALGFSLVLCLLLGNRPVRKLLSPLLRFPFPCEISR